MRRGWVVALVMAGAAAAGCTRDVVPRSAAGPVTVPAPTVVEEATSTTTSSTTTTTAPATVAPAGLGQGDSGPAVRALENRLRELRFSVGTVDDRFDVNTTYAVQAFEKAEGLPRDGRATPAVLDRLARATLEKPLVHGPPTRVEIDLSRQILLLYEGGSLSEILPVSSGSRRPFCTKGVCGDAVTPTGAFQVAYQKQGWETSPLGRLYNPVYFYPAGGIAIHGSPSVPTTPASHGCVRIPMAAAEWFPDRAPVGTPVFVE